MSEWAARWRALLSDASGDVALRGRQGENLVRSGRVTDLRIGAGKLSGSVQGSRATPYVVEIELPTLPEGDWPRVADAVASQVRHSARLLAGQAPETLPDELEAAGVRLFPRLDELDVHCACGQGMCMHAAGVWHAAGDQLAEDPFTLFAVRGRGRQRVLDDVAARRGAVAEPGSAGLALEELQPAGWWDARASLDAVETPGPRRPRVAAPALRTLGDPPGWAGGVSAYDLFRPLVERGADWASALLTEADTAPQ